MSISIEEAQREFGADVAFLNTATYGLPPRAAHEAMLAAERDRAAGLLDHAAMDEAVTRSRASFGRLIGLPPNGSPSAGRCPTSPTWPRRRCPTARRS